MLSENLQRTAFVETAVYLHANIGFLFIMTVKQSLQTTVTTRQITQNK